jgi:hypothetical protein
VTLAPLRVRNGQPTVDGGPFTRLGVVAMPRPPTGTLVRVFATGIHRRRTPGIDGASRAHYGAFGPIAFVGRTATREDEPAVEPEQPYGVRRSETPLRLARPVSRPARKPADARQVESTHGTVSGVDR